MAAAKSSRNDIRIYRLALEEKRVEIKSPALERCRLIDAEAKRITNALLELEEPIAKQITAEEDRKEAERQAQIRAEQDRIEAEQRAIKAAEEARMKTEREEMADEGYLSARDGWFSRILSPTWGTVPLGNLSIASQIKMGIMRQRIVGGQHGKSKIETKDRTARSPTEERPAH